MLIQFNNEDNSDVGNPCIAVVSRTTQTTYRLTVTTNISNTSTYRSRELTL